MRTAIYIISALICTVIYSYATALLLVYGIERMGSDPGSPAILLFGLICTSAIFSMITALIMESSRRKSQRTLPVKISAIIFPIMYFPFHVIGIFFPSLGTNGMDKIQESAATLLVMMMFFSFMPFYHVIAQVQLTIYENYRRNKGMEL